MTQDMHVHAASILKTPLLAACSSSRLGGTVALRLAVASNMHIPSAEKVSRYKPCHDAILAEGAMTLPVTLSGGVLFAS